MNRYALLSSLSFHTSLPWFKISQIFSFPNSALNKTTQSTLFMILTNLDPHPPNQLLNPYDLKQHSESSMNLLPTNKSINFNMTNMPPPLSCIIMNTQFPITLVWLFPPSLAWGTANLVKALEKSREGTYRQLTEWAKKSRKEGKEITILHYLH